MSIEQDFEQKVLRSFSTITERQIKLDLLIEAVEKADQLKQLEIQEKNKLIEELEKTKHDLCHKLAFLKESLLRSSNQVVELESELEVQKLETEKAKNQLLCKQTRVLELQLENLLEEVRNMSSQREDMIAHMEAVYCH